MDCFQYKVGHCISPNNVCIYAALNTYKYLQTNVITYINRFTSASNKLPSKNNVQEGDATMIHMAS